MWTWVVIFVVFLLTFWHAKLRTRSKYDHRAPYRSRSTVTEDIREVDYVVVGAGPGGIAACHRLLTDVGKTATDTAVTVLLVEAGADPLATTSLGELWSSTVSKQRLLCFAPECVSVQGASAVSLSVPQRIDEGYVTRRPFRVSAEGDPEHEASPASQNTARTTTAANESPEQAHARQERERELLYTAYPRGRGVGGGSLLDWGLVVQSTAVQPDTHSQLVSDVAANAPEQTGNPLSWAFRDAVKALETERRRTVSEAPWALGDVFHPILRVDANGRRLPLSSVVLQSLPPAQLDRLSVLAGHQVVRLVLKTEASGGEKTTTDAHTNSGGCSNCRVHEVLVRPSTSSDTGASSDTVSIRVRRGVVLAAGAVHSPRLLYETLTASPLADHRACCAALLQPQQLSVSRGVSSPCVSVRDCLALPFITKTHMRISADRVNLCDAKQSVMYWLTQRGAYLSPFTDSVASIPLPSLGPQAELLIFLLPLGGRDPPLFKRLGWDRILGAFHEAMTMLIVLNGVPDVSFRLQLQPQQREGHAPSHCLNPDAPTALSSDTKAAVHEAFRKGMHLCRDLVTTAPLNFLTPGTEAVDVTLLKQDPAKAYRFAQLSHTPAKHLSFAKKRELAELAAWAMTMSKSSEYEDAYVDQHTYWLGFASGSSAPFLQPGGHAVEGVRNLHVGDASSVTSAEGSTLFKGSVASAIFAGVHAAEALLKL